MSRLVIALVLCSLTLTAYAQDSLNMSRLWQSMPSGSVRRMIREGDVLYVATSKHIMTYDISDFAAPRQLGVRFVSDVVYDFAVHDEQLFVLGYDSLIVLDASSPVNIERIGVAPAYGGKIAVNQEGTLAFVANYAQFNVFDISDPSEPWNTATVFNTLGNNIDVATQGNAVYFLTSWNIQVWDGSIPNDPILLDSLLVDGTARQCVEVIDDTLYALQSGVLHIFELTFPLQPIEIGGGFVDAALYSSNIAKADTMLILAGRDNQFCFASIADLENPVAYPVFQPGQWPRDVIAYGRYALFGLQRDDFYLIDFSNPATPVIEDTLTFGQGSMAHIVVDDVVFSGQYYSAGLWTADLSDLNNVVEIERQYHYPWYAEYAASNGILAAAPDSLGGFDVYDIANPAHPVLQSRVEFEATNEWADYHNDIAAFNHYIIAAFDSVAIFDLADLQQPELVYSGLGAGVKDLAVNNGILWVLGPYDVRGYALDDPRDPVFIGGYSYGGTRDYRMLAVGDAKLYLAGQGHVQAVDVTNPMTPIEISGIGFWGNMEDIDAQNDILAVGGYDGIDIVNYQDPYAPVIVGHHYDNARQITLQGGRLYGSDYYTFNVYDISSLSPANDDVLPELPDRVTIAAYPNPFNPNTTIAFDLADRAVVTLDVFDVTGRRVATLLNEKLNAGSYTKNFDAQSLPSGPYFAQIVTPTVTKTTRITLVR